MTFSDWMKKVEKIAVDEQCDLPRFYTGKDGMFYRLWQVGRLFKNERDEVRAESRTLRNAGVSLLERAELAEAKCAEMLDGLKAVRPIVEFYLEREIKSPANHQDFAQEAQEKLNRFRAVLRDNPGAPLLERMAKLEMVIAREHAMNHGGEFSACLFPLCIEYREAVEDDNG